MSFSSLKTLFFLNSAMSRATVCSILAASSAGLPTPMICPASRTQYSRSEISSSIAAPPPTLPPTPPLLRHLLASCDSRVFSELNASSRSNSSKAGGGRSRNDGGKTCKQSIKSKAGIDFNDAF